MSVQRGNFQQRVSGASLQPEEIEIFGLRRLVGNINGYPIVVWTADKAPNLLVEALGARRNDFVALCPPYWSSEQEIETELFTLFGPLAGHVKTSKILVIADGWIAVKMELVQAERKAAVPATTRRKAKEPEVTS